MAMNADVQTSKSLSSTSISALFETARQSGRVPGFGWADRFGHWALRVPLSGIMLHYGMQKFPDMFLAPGAYGVPAVLFILAALAELLGPVALVAGGIVETWRPRQNRLRLLGDALTRVGAFAGVAAAAGVIVFFYWGVLTLADPQALMLGLALFLLVRGNTYGKSVG